ncbi:MAG: hypothetical protein QG594_2581, partial [Bacteroidota bacterium]|nr:hypothetical protein [Bacteroidota bacterium]
MIPPKNSNNSLLTIIMLIGLMLQTLTLQAQKSILVSQLPNKGAFSLTNCTILCDESDFIVVKKTANLLSNDIEEVTSKQPIVINKNPHGNVIIMGTLGKNRIIDQWVTEKKIDVSRIKGGWEQFIIKRLQKPMAGVEQALVIVGSDRRGTAYGAFTLSNAMGVSPWKWWADVPVKKQSKLFVVNDFISKSPSVKYRGIFIND